MVEPREYNIGGQITEHVTINLNYLKTFVILGTECILIENNIWWEKGPPGY